MKRLGAYELEEEIGRGGMGRVFRARHLPTGATRAVKLLEGNHDLELIERFRREVRALAGLGGGVVAVHDTGTENERLWFAMDFMPGGSLRARLALGGALPWREAVELVLALARTLERAHAQGLIHRDVKPDNVLFDEEKRPRLADFGCVRDLSASRLTATGTMIGTPAYMAPEQLEGGDVDARADVFGLGVILYEATTGRKPHEATQILELFEAIKRGTRPRASELAAVPRALDSVVDRALAAAPSARYPGAAELARDLEALLARKPVAASGGRSRAGPALLALLLVAGTGAALALALRHRSAEPVEATEPAAAIVRSGAHAGENGPSLASGPIHVAELEQVSEKDPSRAEALALKRGIAEDTLSRKLHDLWSTRPTPLGAAVRLVDELDTELQRTPWRDLESALDDSPPFTFGNSPALWKKLMGIKEVRRTFPAVIAPIMSPLVFVARDMVFALDTNVADRKSLARLANLEVALGDLEVPPSIRESLSVTRERPDRIESAAERVRSVDPLLAAALEHRAVYVALHTSSAPRPEWEGDWRSEAVARRCQHVQETALEIAHPPWTKETNIAVLLLHESELVELGVEPEDRVLPLIEKTWNDMQKLGKDGPDLDTKVETARAILQCLIVRGRRRDIDAWVRRHEPDIVRRALGDLEGTLEGGDRDLARRLLETVGTSPAGGK